MINSISKEVIRILIPLDSRFCQSQLKGKILKTFNNVNKKCLIDYCKALFIYITNSK